MRFMQSCKVVAKLESKAVMMVNVSAMCHQRLCRAEQHLVLAFVCSSYHSIWEVRNFFTLPLLVGCARIAAECVDRAMAQALA